MAHNEDQLSALEAALAKSERRVTFGDKTVEYRTVEELQAAIDAVKRDLHGQAVARGLWPKAPRQIRVTTSKGFCYGLVKTYLAPDVRQQSPARCLLYTSPSPRDRTRSRMPSSA